jgi:Zn-dependent M32 family carboxypeptidase
VIAAQLYEALMNKFGADSAYMREVAAWLINTLHRGGELQEWDERIKVATGKSVEPGAFLRKLRIEHTNILKQ